MVVIDSNVFAKLLIEEHDSAIAEDFFRYSITHEVPLLAPTLFYYEVLQIALYYNHSVELTLEFMDEYLGFNLSLVQLTKEQWLDTEKMVHSGHQKSGFPSLYDSSYHALALSKNAVFLTADKRHESKTKQFGAIKLLKHWEEIFDK